MNNLKSLEDYRELRKTFHIDIPKFFNFGSDVIDRWARERPDHVAMQWVSVDGTERTITFREISLRSNQVANALLQLGLQHGDQVLVDLTNRVEWWETMVALTKAGIIAIPGTTLLTEKDIAFRVKSAEIDGVVTDDPGAEKVDHVASDLPELQFKILVGDKPRSGWQTYGELVAAAESTPLQHRTLSEQPSLIYFTSGTTGPPKMVMHTHASYGIGHQLTARFWLGLEPADLHWNLSDTGWAKTAYSGFFAPWIAGSTILVRHSPGKFNPLDVLKCLAEYPITSFCAPPTVYRMLIQQDLSHFRPRSLRCCMAAGEPLNASVLQRWREATGITIREGYGQTETVILCASIPDLPVKPGSMGLPPPGLDVAIVDGNGNSLPTGEQGQIAARVEPTRPVGLFLRYCENPDATANAFRGDWYLTGDCAYTDEDGYFWFVARADDIITSAAYRIGPFEVESAMMEHPAVAEVAVVGKADPERTEIVKAFVVLTHGFAPSDDLVHQLQEHTKQATAPYKYPREIEFLDELPKTHTGKIRRTELRKREA